MRTAVLVKQVPVSDAQRLEDGRLVRAGVPLEVNPYCRRANSLAVALSDDEVVVFTMGPPSADDALREMIACGADRGVHLCDPRFANSDSIATARALALAIAAEGPFDLVLCGQASIDADTGHVGPQVATLLGLPFAGPARTFELTPGAARLRVEADDGHHEVEVALPAVISAAERLCAPSKATPEFRALVDADRIRRVTAADLGLHPREVGQAGSPTRVGTPRLLEVSRAGLRAADVDQAVDLLARRGALDVPAEAGLLPVPTLPPGPAAVWVVLADDAPGPDRSVLMAAPDLAASIGGQVAAVVSPHHPSSHADLGSQGADLVVELPAGGLGAQAGHLGAVLDAERPPVVLFESTASSRPVAAAIAARYGWGLVADAIELGVDPDGRLEAWKSALGGQLLAPITSSSPVQMATVRPGVLPRRARREEAGGPAVWRPRVPSPPAIPMPRVLSREVVDTSAAELYRAPVVIGVGQGVDPADYRLLDGLRAALGDAPLAATRKVTDKGWMPRSRQVGITGLAITPRLYVAVALSGRFNHLAGVRTAGTVLAVNSDADAEVFAQADVGLVGDWRIVVPALAAALEARRPRGQVHEEASA